MRGRESSAPRRLSRTSGSRASKQLEKDYIVMGKERSEADKRTAEHRAQADEVQRKVSPPLRAVPFCSGSHFERVPPSSIIIHNMTSLNIPFISQMADHLMRSKVGLQKLLEEYWILRKRANGCLFPKRNKGGRTEASFRSLCHR